MTLHQFGPRRLRRWFGPYAIDAVVAFVVVAIAAAALISCCAGCAAQTETELTAKLAEDVSAIKAETKITSTRVTNVDEWTERLRSVNDLAQTIGRYWLLIVIAAPLVTYIAPKLLWHAARSLGRRGAGSSGKGVGNGGN